MIAAVAGVIVGVSYILDAGKYDKYPPMNWVLPTVLIIGTFGLIAVGLGIVSPLLLLGLPSMLAIAGTIWLIDKIFNSGKYNKYPSKDWVNPSILVKSNYLRSLLYPNVFSIHSTLFIQGDSLFDMLCESFFDSKGFLNKDQVVFNTFTLNHLRRLTSSHVRLQVAP